MKARTSFASISLVLFIAFATGGQLYAMDGDWGDAPDKPYPTLSANSGAVHLIDPAFYMGASIDPDPDGQPATNADGDDLDGNDDEDGVSFDTVLIPGQGCQITVTASANGGYLDAWIDLNGNGIWESGEKILGGSILLNLGANPIGFNLPASASTGTTYARFRFSRAGGLLPTGSAIDGEVEDYVVDIEEEQPQDPHKMHYPQYPNPNGWDVRACFAPEDGLQKILADDFQCSSNGLITHITFWGSWWKDYYNMEHPFQGIQSIHLSLHDDIPDTDGEGPEYSKPVVPALWEWEINPTAPDPGWSVSEPFMEDPSWQGWYDPNPEPDLVYPNNHTNYFRYEVEIPPEDAFYQTEGTIYWLDISVLTEDGTLWGWKTSRSPHFNDDAVWADLPLESSKQWGELIDPETGESLDLAFIIDGGGEPLEEFDWGDLPDSFNTLSANSGANHLIDHIHYLGALIDTEPDGQPTASADGDDLNGAVPDDEDGLLSVNRVRPGGTGFFVVKNSSVGQIDFWIDFDNSGTWSAGDHAYSHTTLGGPAPMIGIPIPQSTQTGPNHMRIRFTSSTNSYPGGVPVPFGPASDGEVEDYVINIGEEDWGDAPSIYPTSSASGGANHLILGGISGALRLGDLIDGEWDGKPDANATGDDLSNLDDEDGIRFITPTLYPGAIANVAVKTGFGGSGTTGTAYLQGWVDFNGDGDWNDAGEQVYTDRLLSVPASYGMPFAVPANAVGPATTFARFRISTTMGLAPTGYAADGEVEDYKVEIGEALPIDWGDAPHNISLGFRYQTFAYNNGAHHLAVGPFLGALRDGETDGQPTVAADGDDNNGVDDEDGVAFISPLQPGGYAQIEVVASAPGILDAWVDFNGDGWWHFSSEKIFSGQSLGAGINTLSFAVPLVATNISPESTYARFRFTTGGGASYVGLALDGEVEDYKVDIAEIEAGGTDWGDAPDPTYPTLNASGGASHTIFAGVLLGASVDSESNGQPDPQALGDDFGLPLDDEDGVAFVGKIVAGSNGTVNVVAGTGGGMLDAWIDFNKDGIWTEPGERLFGGPLPLAPGSNPGLTFSVPWPPALKIDANPTFARFRISSAGWLPPTGPALDGEVEDYMVDLYQPAPTNLVITNLTFNAPNTVAMVEWTVESDITYQMQASTNLLTNVWADVEAIVLGPSNWQTNNMAGETNKFYRITAPWTE